MNSFEIINNKKTCYKAPLTLFFMDYPEDRKVYNERTINFD